MKFQRYLDQLGLFSPTIQAFASKMISKLTWPPAYAFVGEPSVMTTYDSARCNVWCKEQLQGQFINFCSSDFWFELENDALMFKLAWGEFEAVDILKE
jgi:hypothetical protein